MTKDWTRDVRGALVIVVTLGVVLISAGWGIVRHAVLTGGDPCPRDWTISVRAGP